MDVPDVRNERYLVKRFTQSAAEDGREDHESDYLPIDSGGQTSYGRLQVATEPFR